MANTTIIDHSLALARIDFAPRYRQPSVLRMALATLLSLAGSLAADALVVVIATALFPSTKGYVHFQFDSYARLTIIGVLIACAAWPVVIRITSSPRWLFFRLAIVVTVVLLAPDLWLLAKHQPARAVAALMVMHLAIGLVTYNALIRVAALRRGEARDSHATSSQRAERLDGGDRTVASTETTNQAAASTAPAAARSPGADRGSNGSSTRTRTRTRLPGVQRRMSALPGIQPVRTYGPQFEIAPPGGVEGRFLPEHTTDGCTGQGPWY